MTPRAGNTFTYGGHRAAASAGHKLNAKGFPHISNGTVIPTAGTHAAASPSRHGMQTNVPPSPRAFLQSTAQILMSVLEKQKKREEKQMEAHQHSKRHSWMAAIHAARPQPQQSRTVAAHIHRINKTKKRRQGVAVCVWRCGCLPALAAKKQNKGERNVCSAPQALVARPHVTAPSARRSSRPLLMRAAGEAHRAVVMSVSVGVRVEQLGGKHTAPLAGRVQKKQLKEGRVEKKKTSTVIAPKAKKESMGMRN
ncbi:hypothetical protein ECC02_007420 [Trypanosoma cruzi]|uniref:Uncharacterized protein n=1 Tax=Trypanosoma cruzi TaxID=5693 RepID=A0A7J6XZ27_TRYCR|nr:hypothetical protein ECC02_007420 [Trypanosoma cruzi]